MQPDSKKGTEERCPFPCKIFLDEFAFLLEEYGFIRDEIILGRGVAVVLRKGDLGVVLSAELDDLPDLKFVIYRDEQSKRRKKAVYLDDEMMQAFDHHTPPGTYKISEKMDTWFWPKAFVYMFVFNDRLNEEIKARIREYAQFVRAHYDEIWPYVRERKVRPSYLN